MLEDFTSCLTLEKGDIFLETFLKSLDIKITENTEIEARLGTIVDHMSNERIKIPAIHPVIFRQNKKYGFNSGVSEKDYNILLASLTDLDYKEKKDTIKIKRGCRERWEDGKMMCRIWKARKQTYQIYVPNSLYDIRISISEEMPIDSRETEVVITRERERKSIEFLDYSLDITKVTCDLENSFEVELEIVKEEFNKVMFKDVLLNFVEKFFACET